MASEREILVDMGFFRGRNGFTDPTRLMSNGSFSGQCKEQIGFASDKDILETIKGDELYGSEISSSIKMTGLSAWGDDLVAVNGTSSYIYDGDWYSFGASLTTTLPTTFLVNYDELYLSNGTDDVRRCVKTDVATAVEVVDTTIVVDDASKFTNGVGKIYIEGDEIDYIGVSAGTIIEKTFDDTPYTATAVEKTINVDTSGGNVTIALPTAVGISDTVYIIHKTTSDANTVTIDPDGTETVDFTSTKVLSSEGSSAVIRSDGSNWITTTLSYAGANILDNVTNIGATHAVDKKVIEAKEDSAIPKGLAMQEFLGKFWLAKVSSTAGLPQDKNNVYYSATANPSKPENFYTFNEQNNVAVTEVAATYTANGFDTNIEANATAAAFTITLITAVGNAGLKYKITKIDNVANSVTVDGKGSETIDGAGTLALVSEGDSVYIESDGANWISTSLEPTGSGVELFIEGGDTTALLNYNNKNLLVSQENKIETITGFDLTQFPPLPQRQILDSNNGAVNEDCLVKMAGDVIYFTSDRRLKRLSQPDGAEGIRQFDGFDLPVLDVLEDIDTDQSEAAMIYNERTRLLYLSVKTEGSTYNNLRLVYSTDNGSWWLEKNMFCRKYTILKGKLYYAHSITGRVIKDETGYTHDGYSVNRKYTSMSFKSPQRELFAHHLFEGVITPNTVATVKFYVNDSLIRIIKIDSNDIVGVGSSNQAAIGDGTVGDTMWGSGTPPLIEPSSVKRYEKVVSLGKKGKKYYYIIELNGLGEQFTVDTSVMSFLQESKASRLQSTS